MDMLLWSWNKIVISADENTETIPELLKKTIFDDWSNFSFSQIMPIPFDIVENDKTEWRNENWGTSWEPNENKVHVDDINSEIKISCSTYEKPPLPFLQYLSSIYEVLGKKALTLVVSDELLHTTLVKHINMV
jgi:hypothetical protein